MTVNPRDNSYTNFQPAEDAKSATATVKLPNGKEVEVSLNYSKKTSEEQMQTDLQKSVKKIVGLSLAYELGSKTQSLTISGNKLTKVYTEQGLANRNANRAAKPNKPKLENATQVSSKPIDADEIGEKLKKLGKQKGAVKQFINDFTSKQNQSETNIQPKGKRPIPPPRNMFQPIQGANIQGNEEYPKESLIKNIDTMYNASAEAIRAYPGADKSNLQERTTNAKNLTKELICLLERTPNKDPYKPYGLASALKSEASSARIEDHQDSPGDGTIGYHLSFLMNYLGETSRMEEPLKSEYEALKQEFQAALDKERELNSINF
jgi:hypothetical protein